MKVRAKFRCNTVQQFEGGQEKVDFMPVTTGSEENKTWSKYTPSGSLSMTITAEGAVGQFKPGKEYYLDIVPAE